MWGKITLKVLPFTVFPPKASEILITGLLTHKGDGEHIKKITNPRNLASRCCRKQGMSVLRHTNILCCVFSIQFYLFHVSSWQHQDSPNSGTMYE